jgi:hypothetical protein
MELKMADLDTILVAPTPAEEEIRKDDTIAVDLNQRLNKDLNQRLNNLTIPEDQLMTATDELLKDRIHQLSLLLDQVEDLETRPLIEFQICLYKQFLSENCI